MAKNGVVLVWSDVGAANTPTGLQASCASTSGRKFKIRCGGAARRLLIPENSR